MIMIMIVIMIMMMIKELLSRRISSRLIGALDTLQQEEKFDKAIYIVCAKISSK